MKKIAQGYGKMLLVGMVYMSLFVIAACNSNETEKDTTEPAQKVEPVTDPRVVDTLKTDSTAEDKEGATRVIR